MGRERGLVMYNYQRMKPQVFTEEGFKKIDIIKKNMEGREVLTVNEAMKNLTGDSWHSLACVDYLVEYGSLKYVLKEGATQDYILKVC